MSHEQSHIDAMQHEYDGIREYDNPTPGWWNWLFALSVFFSLVYWAVYHFDPVARTIHAQWEDAQTAEFARIFGSIGELRPDAATIVRMMHDDRMMAVARGIFAGNCAACHARDGGGISGPNLTDEKYKNIRSLEDFFHVITKGANNQAMPAWENRLSENERIILAAYAASLRGTTPATPKLSEGDISLPPWPEPESAEIDATPQS